MIVVEESVSRQKNICTQMERQTETDRERWGESERVKEKIDAT